MRGLEISFSKFRLGNKRNRVSATNITNYFCNVGRERFRFSAMGAGTRRVVVGGVAVAPNIEGGHAQHR